MSRRAAWLAWSLCGLCVALAAGSLLLAVLNGRTPGEILVGESILTIAMLTAAFSVVGALIASHCPGNSIGWIFCAAALCQGLANIGSEYAIYALLTRPGLLPLGAGISWIGNWIWARSDPGVLAPPVPRRATPVAPLAVGGVARRRLRRGDHCTGLSPSLAREGHGVVEAPDE
jgi:hypothetical protein